MSSLNTNSLLWKFYKPGEKRTHYLFGTMHLKSKDAHLFLSSVKSYINRSETYAAETDLEEMANSDLLEHFVFQNNDSLVDFYTGKQIAKIERILRKAFGMELKKMLHCKPIFIVNQITEHVLRAEYSLTLDKALWDYALEQNKLMTGIETLQNQQETFEKITLEFQLKQLKDVIRNVSKYRRQLKSLSSSYANQDINSLYKSTKKSMGGLRGSLVYKRNQNMVERIIELSKTSSCFISVGAAHLAGRYGILRGLKKLGYKIDPIKL